MKGFASKLKGVGGDALSKSRDAAGALKGAGCRDQCSKEEHDAGAAGGGGVVHAAFVLAAADDRRGVVVGRAGRHVHGDRRRVDEGRRLRRDDRP